MNITVDSTSNATGYTSDFFGLLNISVTFENATSAGSFLSNLVTGGIIGYL